MCQSDDGGDYRGKSKWRVVDENCSEKRDGIVAIWKWLWRSDPKIDGERLKSEVKIIDKEYKEKLEAEAHVQVPKRVRISRENFEEFGCTARCPGCMHVAPQDCETSNYEKLSKADRGGAEGHSQGTRGNEANGRVPRQSG